MDLQLQGKVVLVSGGSKGIGRACAEGFAREGCRVAIVSRGEAALKQAREELATKGFEVMSVAADLTRAEDAARAAAEVESRLGPIDVLVNSAGAAPHHPLKEIRAEDWHHGMDAKYFTTVHLIQAVIPGMGKRRKGVVINIIGMGGKVGRPEHIAGGAANAALMLVTTSLAVGYGPDGVRVNAINPGATLTERQTARMEKVAAAGGKSVEQQLADQSAMVPLRRMATPEDIAKATLFLASECAAYINGVIIPMDGGKLAVI